MACSTRDRALQLQGAHPPSHRCRWPWHHAMAPPPGTGRLLSGRCRQGRTAGEQVPRRSGLSLSGSSQMPPEPVHPPPGCSPTPWRGARMRPGIARSRGGLGRVHTAGAQRRKPILPWRDIAVRSHGVAARSPNPGRRPHGQAVRWRTEIWPVYSLIRRSLSGIWRSEMD